MHQNAPSQSPAGRTILIYVSNLLPWSETFIREQVRALRRWRAILVGIHRMHQLPLDGLDIHMLQPKHPSLVDGLRWKFAALSARLPRSAGSLLRKQAASLIHAHFGVEGIKAWPIAQALDVPLLITLHGYDINIKREWWEAGHGGRAMRSYPARLLRLSAEPRVHFIAVSDAVRRRAMAFGLPEDKISVRYIGIDTARFTPAGRPVIEREPRVLFVGRLVEKKGCEFLIRAFAKVQAEVPKARLVIVGDGPLRDPLQRLAQDLSFSVQFRGPLSSADISEELHLAKVFCLPSITAANGDAEGFGLVLLEAQASAVPVVTSALGGAVEGMRDGVTGFAFRERDVATLASHLIRLLTDNDVAASLAAAGPKFVAEKLDLLRCTADLEALYDSVLANDRTALMAHGSTLEYGMRGNASI